MALVKAETKRAIVSAIARAGTVAGLLASLQSFQDSAFAASKGGKTLASSSGAGHSAMFAILDSMPPDEILGLSQEIIEIFNDASDALIAASNAKPTDAQILAQMFLDNRLYGTTESRADFSELRDFITR